MNITTIKERGVESRGMIRIKRYTAGTLAKAEPYALQYMQALRAGQVDMLARLKMETVLAGGFIETAVEAPNLIMQGTLTGKDLFIQYLIQGTIYTGINFGAIGTGTTTPAVTDTQLTTESYRVPPTLFTDVSNNQAQIRFFMADANLTNATYKEFGMFMNGSVTANSGKIFNHSLFGTPYVKTTGIDTTIEVDITLT